jgi:elongation factor G
MLTTLTTADASAGNILFGGIDTAKFEGPLTRVKLYPTHRQSAVDEFAVALTSVTAVSKSGSDKLGSASFPAPVILDSGTTVSFLPEDLVAEIYREANVITDDSGTGAVPCSYANAQGYFSFGFGGPGGAVVNVSMSELVLGVAGTITGGSHKGQDACTFGIQAVSSNDTFILGDTFLRSAFVVYDLVNNEAALAQTKFNVSDSNVIAFASLSATVPSSTPAPSQDAISQGVVTATPASYAAAAAFTASSGAAGPLGPGGGVAGVALATLVSFGVGVFSFFVL